MLVAGPGIGKCVARLQVPSLAVQGGGGGSMIRFRAWICPGSGFWDVFSFRVQLCDWFCVFLV
jgi:hypothetical protein